MSAPLKTAELHVPPAPTIEAIHDAIYRKITVRFIFLLFLCYVFNYLDRTNVGFAQLQIKGDLGFSDIAYGVGASIFFISYAVFQLPANLIMAKIGARRTIFVSSFGWGLISASTMFVHTPIQFYIARFALGIVEAGFFPGIIFYFTKWFPSHRRATVSAFFLSGAVVSAIVSGIVSGGVMTYMNGYGGLRGWQWMFLVEGLPSVVLGVIVFFYLDDKPADAKWLSDSEKKIVLDALANDRAVSTAPFRLKNVLLDWRVYMLGMLYFFGSFETFVLAFWQPTMIKTFGVSSVMMIGLFSTIPAVIAVAAKIIVGRSSDSKKEFRWHFTVPALAGAAGFLLMWVFPHSPWWGIFCLTLAYGGAHATMPIIFAAPGMYWSGTSAAAAIAIINSMGTIAGAIGPAMVGYIKTATGSFAYSNMIQSSLLIIGSVMILTLVSRKDELRTSTDEPALDAGTIKNAPAAENVTP